MTTVAELKYALRLPNREVFVTVCVPGQAAQKTNDQPIIVPATKSGVKAAIKHLPNKTAFPFALDGNKIIVGAVI